MKRELTQRPCGPGHGRPAPTPTHNAEIKVGGDRTPPHHTAGPRGGNGRKLLPRHTTSQTNTQEPSKPQKLHRQQTIKKTQQTPNPKTPPQSSCTLEKNTKGQEQVTKKPNHVYEPVPGHTRSHTIKLETRGRGKKQHPAADLPIDHQEWRPCVRSNNTEKKTGQALPHPNKRNADPALYLTPRPGTKPPLFTDRKETTAQTPLHTALLLAKSRSPHKGGSQATTAGSSLQTATQLNCTFQKAASTEGAWEAPRTRTRGGSRPNGKKRQGNHQLTPTAPEQISMENTKGPVRTVKSPPPPSLLERHSETPSA